MTPTETAALYRKALEQRVVSVASRTPMSNPKAVPAAHPSAPTPFAATSPTPVAYVTAQGAFAAPAPPRTNDPIPELRRRRRIFPWVFALALAGWAFIVSTGRTDQARAVFDAVVSNITGLIGTTRSLTEAPAPSAAPSAARARRTTPSATQAPDIPTDTSDGDVVRDSLIGMPAIVAPTPSITPMRPDSLPRPALPPNDNR